jgi:hypothetical protein
LNQAERLQVAPFGKLLQLSAREAWLLLQAAVLLPMVRLALHLFTVSRLKDVRTNAREARMPHLPPQATARLVRVAAQRGLCRAKCLEQSLVLRWLLLRQGIDARIFFGARKENDEMQAHAWVEVDGVSLDEDDSTPPRFSPFEKPAASGIN